MENDPHSRLTCLFMMCICYLSPCVCVCRISFVRFAHRDVHISLLLLLLLSPYNYNSQNHNSAWHYRISCYFIVSLPFFCFIFVCCCFCINISIKALVFNYFNVFDRMSQSASSLYSVQSRSTAWLVHRRFRIDFRGEMFQLFPKNKWHFQRKLLLS